MLIRPMGKIDSDTTALFGIFLETNYQNSKRRRRSIRRRECTEMSSHIDCLYICSETQHESVGLEEQETTGRGRYGREREKILTRRSRIEYSTPEETKKLAQSGQKINTTHLRL